MSEIIFVEKIAYVSSGIRCEIDISRFRKQSEEAQWFLGEKVLQDCKPFMPKRDGILQDNSMVLREGREVLFPGPYARFLYMGKKMVDSETGRGPFPTPDGPRYRKGATLVATDKDLTYSAGGPKWFDAAKAAHGEAWIAEVKRIGGGG